MAYASEADLDRKWGAEFVTLLSFDESTQARDHDKIAAALAAATAQMNGWLAKRYTPPIDASADGLLLLKNLCADLAVGELANTPGTRNEIVTEAVAAARKFMADVASGRADIPQNPPPGAPAPAVSPNEAIVAANDREFTRNRLRGL